MSGYHASGFISIAARLPSIMLLWATIATSVALGSSLSMQIPLPGRNTVVDLAFPSPSTERILKTDYDYIIVGGGPAGIVVADRLSESSPSVKVLLIDRGDASTWGSGGREQTWWMKGHNLTRFDVPGLFQFGHGWNHFCDDIEPLAGCVLGGGTAINSGLYFYPPDQDWDANFPPGSGWTSKDTVTATKKARERIPSTETPSVDGKPYLTEPYDILGTYLSRKGWVEASPNGQVNARNKNYGRSSFMTIGGERAGPLGPYLVSALNRKNFDLLLNSKVSRVVRSGKTVYGVEIGNSSAGKSTIYVKGGRGFAKSHSTEKSLGKVILSAGTLGSPKILFRSGIGPRDVLEVVRDNSGKESITPEEEWVELPVGHNLVDHTATHVIFRHPNISPYNHSGAWENPNPEDLDLYLQRRSGPLAATNAKLSFWMTIKGDDGVSRVIQGNARAGSELGYSHPNNLLVTLYLGRGMTSRGRLTLTPTPDLKVKVQETPYLSTDADQSAVITAIETLLSNFTSINTYDNNTKLELILPESPSPDAIEKYVREYPLGSSLRRGGNHWMGTCMMGDEGEGVVDWNGKVRGGVKGLYVLDASVFRGMVSANPVGTIVVVAERGVERILKEERGERGERGEREGLRK